MPPQPVAASSCMPTAAAICEAGFCSDAGSDASNDGGSGAASSCPYGPTMYGTEADDDDCKYHLKWTSSEICKGSAGVAFTVTLTNAQTMQPVTDIPAAEGVRVEAFIPASLDASCDVTPMHLSPRPLSPLFQTTPTSGVYTGTVIFDAPGEWTVRFHIHEECVDLFDSSPHGHAAFHVTLPP